MPGELLSDPQHGQEREGDPAGRVRLLQAPSGGHFARPVEDRDVVHPEEAALEQVAAGGVLAVEPPRGVQQQLGQHGAEERAVPCAVDQVDLPGRPGVHRRVDVGERPLVGGELAVRVLGPLPADQQQLVLGQGRVDVRERDGVERQVPGREPRVLPVVRHAHHVGELEVRPGRVAGRRGRAAAREVAAGTGRPRATRAPSSGRPACPTAARRTRGARRRDPRPAPRSGITRGVERVGLGPARPEHGVELVAERLVGGAAVGRRAASA